MKPAIPGRRAFFFFGAPVGKPNYQREKRSRDLARQKKQEEKRQKKVLKGVRETEDIETGEPVESSEPVEPGTPGEPEANLPN